MADGSEITPRPCGEGRYSAPAEVWAQVRDDYLAGMSAPEACGRHGVSLGALRTRAAREGWRRRDQPWSPPPNRLDPLDEGVTLEDRVGGDLDQVELRELSWVAHRRMMRAVLRGEAAEALRWRRVRKAMDQEDEEVEREIGQDEAIRSDRIGQAEAEAWTAAQAPADAVDAVDAVDGVDPVLSGAGA